MPFSCQWILSVLNKAVGETVSSLESYEFSDASSAVYSWWQFQFCDVFIEVIKPYFSSNDGSFASERDSAQAALWVCLDTGLRLLHPFTPFVTEELWQRHPQARDTFRKESIVISEYPSVIQSWTSERVEHEMELIEVAVRSLRSLKSSLPPKERNERQKETLEKMMGATGYKEKVAVQIREDNDEKLTKLMQEVLSLEEAGQHLEGDIIASDSCDLIPLETVECICISDCI